MNIKTKNKEYDQFNKLSGEWWDESGKFKVLHQIRPLRMKYILDNIEKNSFDGLEIIDIGCGGGLISEPLSKLGANVTAIDFVENNIKIAKNHSKKNGLNIKYICSDIEKYQFKKKFDVIILFEVLEHLDDWQNFILKIKNNLKDNGKIIVSTINRNIFSKIATIYIAENIIDWIPKGTHDYKKFIKPEEIDSFLTDNKMELNKLRGYVFNPLDSSWGFSNNTLINYFCTIVTN